MATTTPNFGWAVPTSTDLVKDGAVAIETLGDSIDASLVDLKGGTTGQVLAKASGTDMDFSWTAIDPLVILDAKGDLITATAADTPARLAVGTNGQTLVADSSTATGLKWATASAGAKSYSLLNAGGTALTGSTTVTVSGISSIEDLLILVNTASSANASAEFLIRFNGDTGANYTWFGGSIDALSSYGAGVVDAVGGMTETSLILGKLATSASGKIRAGLKVSGCSGSGLKVFQATTGSEFVSGQTGQRGTFTTGLWTGSAVTSVSITSSTGNLDGGTIYVYGAA